MPDAVASFGTNLPAAVYAGMQTTVHATAYDANGLVDKEYSGTADLTTTASGVTFSTTAVQFHNGTATFEVTFGTAGTSEPITLTDSAISTATDTFSTKVIADVATGYVISLPSRVTAGQPVSVQVTAVDNNGTTVSSYSGTATVTITGASTTSENITFSKGVATFSVTFASSAAGTQGTVTVTDQATTWPSADCRGVHDRGPARPGWRWRLGHWRSWLGRRWRLRRLGRKWFRWLGRFDWLDWFQRFEWFRRDAAANATTSTNWSGYAIQSTNGSVTAVSGTWTVPSVTGGVGYSAVWVGIDGYQSSTVEQIGTEQDTGGGGDYAWYEMYPGDSVNISSLAISAGNSITATVVYSGGSFTLTLTDNTTGKSFTTQQSGSTLQRSSAEWIVEAPWSGGVLPLADFSTVAFTSASTTINGVTGGISNSAWKPLAIDMTSGLGATEATTSVLNSGGNGFSVSYTSSAASGGLGSYGLGGGGGWYSANSLTQYSIGGQNPLASQQAALDYLFGSELEFPVVASDITKNAAISEGGACVVLRRLP